MPSIARGLLWGAVAGAVGASALNVTTYLDMLIRGRPASEAPQRLVEQLALEVGVGIPVNPDERMNRAQALGSLSGLLTGITVGMTVGALRQSGIRPPAWISVPVISLTAMTAADLPLAITKISDPTDWSTTDWLADLLPHLVFGSVVHVALTSSD